VIRSIPGAWRRLASLAVVAWACMQLSGCGGSVSGAPSAPTSAGPLAITPSTATLYSDLPSTFLVTGGSGVYTVISSDQAVLPVASTLNGAAFTVAPNEVAADTTVTLTVRDNAGSLPATATVTVKPRTINNSVTVTPSASQSASCGTAICAGGDAVVTATLSQAGVPLTGRTVRFDILSGDLGIITSAPGDTETTATTATTTTDSSGTARIRVRALPNATPQTALLQITDVSSGFTQSTSVTIASASNAPLNAQPNQVNFIGPNSNSCATGVSADVIVFGGRPPYQITQASGFTVNPTTLSTSGSHFTITATGQCTLGGVNPTPTSIAIVDANGGTTSISVTNLPAPATPNTAAFAAAPTEVTLDSCTTVATVALVGGTGHYFGTSGSNALFVNTGRTFATIQRLSGTTTTLSSINVVFNDGQTLQTVKVDLTGTATSASGGGSSGSTGTCP
jgi:hypothetical protein